MTKKPDKNIKKEDDKLKKMNEIGTDTSNNINTSIDKDKPKVINSLKEKYKGVSRSQLIEKLEDKTSSQAQQFFTPSLIGNIRFALFAIIERFSQIPYTQADEHLLETFDKSGSEVASQYLGNKIGEHANAAILASTFMFITLDVLNKKNKSRDKKVEDVKPETFETELNESNINL